MDRCIPTLKVVIFNLSNKPDWNAYSNSLNMTVYLVFSYPNTRTSVNNNRCVSSVMCIGYIPASLTRSSR